MAEQTAEIAQINPAEFRDDEHRNSHLTALENEYKGLLTRTLSLDGDNSERWINDGYRRLNEVDGELKRIRGEGFPGHENRLAAPTKTTRTAATQ